MTFNDNQTADNEKKKFSKIFFALLKNSSFKLNTSNIREIINRRVQTVESMKNSILPLDSDVSLKEAEDIFKILELEQKIEKLDNMVQAIDMDDNYDIENLEDYFTIICDISDRYNQLMYELTEEEGIDKEYFCYLEKEIEELSNQYKISVKEYIKNIEISDFEDIRSAIIKFELCEEIKSKISYNKIRETYNNVFFDRVIDFHIDNYKKYEKLLIPESQDSISWGFVE